MSEEMKEMEEKQDMMSQEASMNEVTAENEGREDDRAKTVFFFHAVDALRRFKRLFD